LLVARSTPVYPIQEIWSQANRENIQNHHLLVMNQAGTFDFRVGEQKRSPKIIRHLRLERLWRLILDPKRNYKKVVDSLGILHYIFSYLLLKKR
jgi:UDP-N-acetyl-D-mannosaminuronic acid transferase (WecB/TagA/CpsF family)